MRELAEGGDSNTCSAIKENRELWLSLEGDQVSLLATLPFVIVEVQFADVSWWATPAKRQTPSSVTAGTGVASEGSAALMDEVAMFAWQVVRWDRTTAQLSLGMTQAVAELLMSLNPQQMREIAKAGASWLKLRWNDDASFWRELIIAAAQGDSKSMSVLSLHAKLRLCSELARR